jgi:hypothetical protein
MNVIMTESGKFIEVQGTAERQAFDRKQLDELLTLAEGGLRQLFALQRDIISAYKEQHRKDKKNIRPGAGLSSLGDALKEIEI